MSETPKASDRTLQQLQNMAEAKAAIGEASAIEAAVPELVAEIFALRAQRDVLQTERHVAVELINTEGLTGEYVHRLDAEGLVDHKAHDGVPAGTGAETSLSSEAVLHLYPLADEHGDAAISANSGALRMLHDVIERLLEDHGPLKSADEVRVFAADGEGFDLSIEKREGPPHASIWEQLPEPYYVPRRRAREAGMDV